MKNKIEFADEISSLQASFIDNAIKLIDKYGRERNKTMNMIADILYAAIKLGSFTEYKTTKRNKGVWFSVKDRLPEKSGKYLVCTNRGNVYQTKFYSYPEERGGHWGQKDHGKSITHWMPLPDAPKGGDTND